MPGGAASWKRPRLAPSGAPQRLRRLFTLSDHPHLLEQRDRAREQFPGSLVLGPSLEQLRVIHIATGKLRPGTNLPVNPDCFSDVRLRCRELRWMSAHERLREGPIGERLGKPILRLVGETDGLFAQGRDRSELAERVKRLRKQALLPGESEPSSNLLALREALFDQRPSPARISAKGAWRFFWTSFESARKGDT